MKVISGFLKGRNIEGFNINGTRPTMDRVKESLFASIQGYLNDSIVLDLFSGSGNLGIEAISNGSKKVYFNDVSRDAIKVINKNIINFGINEKSVIFNKDYKEALTELKNSNVVFDIIFLDPPYKKEILNSVIDKILEYNLLSSNGIIVCEVSNDYINDNLRLERIKEKKYGDKLVIILKNIENE